MKLTTLLLCVLVAGCHTLSASDNQKKQSNNQDTYTVIIKSPYDKPDDHLIGDITIGPKERANLQKLSAQQAIQIAQDSVQNKSLIIYGSQTESLLQAIKAHGEAALLLRAYADVLFKEMSGPKAREEVALLLKAHADMLFEEMNNQDVQAKKINSKL